MLNVCIYGSRVAATPVFKYLGVHLSSDCLPDAHVEAWATAFQTQINDNTTIIIIMIMMMILIVIILHIIYKYDQHNYLY